MSGTPEDKFKSDANHFRRPKPTADKNRIYTAVTLQKVRAALLRDSHPAAREAEGVIASYEGILDRLDVKNEKGNAITAALAENDRLEPFRIRWREFPPVMQAAIKAEIQRVQASYAKGRSGIQRQTADGWQFIRDLVAVVEE